MKSEKMKKIIRKKIIEIESYHRNITLEATSELGITINKLEMEIETLKRALESCEKELEEKEIIIKYLEMKGDR